MPENEFEKKISTEMQELRFKPSETVWIRVEERIRRKKKRRVFIIFFLLAGIALLGYWQWDNFFGEKNGGIVQSETPVEEKNDTLNDKDQNIHQDSNVSNQTQQIKSGEKSDTDETKVVGTKKSTGKIENVSENHVTRQIRIEDKKVSLTKQKKDIAGIEKEDPEPTQRDQVTLNEEDRPTEIIDEPSAVKDSAKVIRAETSNVNQDLKQNIAPTVNADSTKPDTVIRKDVIKKDSAVKKIDSILRTVPADSTVVNIQKKPVNKKWRFGIEFIPGVSSFHEEIFSFNMNKSAADVFAGGPGSGSGNVAPSDPVKSRSGFAFQFGGFFKKQITQRSGYSVGLRWAYYSEQLRMGARMIPATQSPAFLQLLNALGATSAYDAGGYDYYAVNDYHFIELPVNYNVQLNKGEAHPLNLQAGVKVAQMLTSNALVYDTAAGGIYYTSKKYFNKTQFGISTSLNWKFTKKDKFYMAVGPAFDMNLNSLLDNPYDKKKYLLFAGLRASVIFNSKK